MLVRYAEGVLQPTLAAQAVHPGEGGIGDQHRLTEPFGSLQDLTEQPLRLGEPLRPGAELSVDDDRVPGPVHATRGGGGLEPGALGGFLGYGEAPPVAARIGHAAPGRLGAGSQRCWRPGGQPPGPLEQRQRGPRAIDQPEEGVVEQRLQREIAMAFLGQAHSVFEAGLRELHLSGDERCPR